eukprot:TRINITY_DN617_c3_g1_i1.p1 TRINITY_DN617_c3_g1~~TRINITY_DN617_c3_g1_i1.p1  ORF type:complete len:641 (-),score=345.32 TRINITY_DN617_c3_g1_i1:30-1826(-)
MTFQRRSIFASLPAPTRGKSTFLSGDPRGENFLYACGNTVVIRNIRNPGIADLYCDHSHTPTVARYAPSGFYIASADVQGNVRIWDTTQAEHATKIELRPISGVINDLAWTEDSKRIVVVGEGREKYGAAFFWDTGASVGEITGHSKPILSVDVKQSRPYRLVTAAEDFLAGWYEGPPFKLKTTIREHSRYVNCIRFSPNGELFVTVGADKKLVFYDGKTGVKLREVVDAHAGGIYACSWNSLSTHLLTVSGDRSAKVWDANTGQAVTTYNFGNAVEDQQLGCLWQGDNLLSMSLSGQIHYLDPNNAAHPRLTLLGHNRFVTSLTYDRNSNTIFSGSYDAAIVRWDFNSGATEALSGTGHFNQINTLHAVGDRLVSCALDDSARFSSITNKSYDAKVGLDGPTADIAVGQTARLSVAVTNKSINLIRDNAIVTKLEVSYVPRSAAISKNENEVAVGAEDSGVYIFSLNGNTLTQTHKLDKNRGPVTSIAYSPDGNFLATADKNREIIVFDSTTKQVRFDGWCFHTASVNHIVWSPDSTHLASASLDQNIIVWSVVDSSKRILIRGAHRGGVNKVAWIDSNTLASAGQDCTIKSWTLTY